MHTEFWRGNVLRNVHFEDHEEDGMITVNVSSQVSEVSCEYGTDSVWRIMAGFGISRVESSYSAVFYVKQHFSSVENGVEFHPVCCKVCFGSVLRG
jgi:hypothetical protein